MSSDTDAGSNYCETCKRLKGIGCACGLSFAEKARGIGMSLPPAFKAVKDNK